MARIKTGTPSLKEIREGESEKRYIPSVGLVNYTRYNNQLFSSKMYSSQAPPVVDKKLATSTITNIITTTGTGDSATSESALPSSAVLRSTSISSLTNARIPFINSSGRLTDDSDLTFTNSNTLTVTNLGAFTATGSINFNDQAMTNVDINSGAIDGVSLGTGTAITQAVIDSININSNTIGHTDDTDLMTLTDGNVTFTGTTVIPTADINGGAIDGATIGASSATTGSFTTLSSSGNTTLGDASADSLTINAETINTPNIAAGTDNSVVVYNGSSLVTDEIDSRVWGSTLIDATNGTDSRIAIFTDSNSVEGDSNLTFTTDGLIVGNKNISVGSASTPNRLSDLISGDQEVFFGGILDSGNNKFTFAGNNGDGTTTLGDTDGFALTNCAFVVNSGVGRITNSASSQGFARLGLTTVVDKIYNIGFDVTGGNSEIEMSLSATTSWDASSQTGNRSTGTGHSLVNNFTATGTTSYLLIRLISDTNTEYAEIDNLEVKEETSYTGGEIGSPSFESGFAGSGWKFDLAGTSPNEFDLTVDNMYVRGTLNVYELLIQQIRATNGAVFVTSAAKVQSVTGLSNNDSDGDIVFEDPSGNKLCPFATNDLIMMQRVVPGSLTAGTSTAGAVNVIKKLVYQVSSVSGATATVTSASGFTNTTFPSKGDDFVRIGSTSDSDRRGIIYLTSDDANAPYIDIKDGCNTYAAWGSTSTTKARLGKLSGITHNSASLSGYGLFSDNVYLTGDITATTGYIGGTSGWTIATNKLSSTYNSNIIGLVQQSSAHADVGSVSAFYAGASADTGQGASISFGSDGKIRGNGIYRRGSVDYLITTSRIFGNGSDGVLTINSSTMTEHRNDSGTSLGDNWISSGALQRDIYCTNLTINSSITCKTNGYRIFVRDTLTIGGSGAKFYNNGSNGANGSDGTSGGNGGTGGSGSGAGGAQGSLRGGVTGGNGGDGGNTGGLDGDVGSQGTQQTNVVKAYTNSAAAKGGHGGGAAGSGHADNGLGGLSNAAAASTGSEGKISMTNSDLTYIIAMRDIFAVGDSAPSLYPATGASGGGGGGGGDNTGSGGSNAGKPGGGGGQAGGSGGHVMVIARIISGTQSNLTLQSKGGDGGGGGRQGSTGYAIGGKGAGGNGGDGGCVTLISGTDPSSVTIDVGGGDPGSNGASGSDNSIGTPQDGTDGTSIIIHC